MFREQLDIVLAFATCLLMFGCTNGPGSPIVVNGLCIRTPNGGSIGCDGQTNPQQQNTTSGTALGEYEVACGPGYAPTSYNNTSSPTSFTQWSCSNGSTFYNAAPTCPPQNSAWRIWQVRNGRTQQASQCPP